MFLNDNNSFGKKEQCAYRRKSEVYIVAHSNMYLSTSRVLTYKKVKAIQGR